MTRRCRDDVRARPIRSARVDFDSRSGIVMAITEHRSTSSKPAAGLHLSQRFPDNHGMGSGVAEAERLNGLLRIAYPLLALA
jgi:hypothetical protein